ncbi:inactive pancreatic lipase-related protein 1-like, partial [Patella vulgata]|uniref:inactive pancreatic lipase-related protein 1-like n=1 Tax=Patella vulgata TaxID=6465 RepID=UPI0024A7E614
SITDSHFDSELKTILIIHGYTDEGDAAWEDANVIAVNWKEGAAQINYFKAVANTRVVGAVAAQLIKDLKSVGGISYSNVHIIGHSLGSHIAGYIGEIIPGLGRITGLDPAGLGFENYDVTVRLDPSDADYVDAIHTDGETLLQLGLTSDVACSHMRAIDLFTESINGDCTFNSFPCSSWSNFENGQCLH